MRTAAAVVVAGLVLGLSACSGDEDAGAAAPTTQVTSVRPTNEVPTGGAVATSDSEEPLPTAVGFVRAVLQGRDATNLVKEADVVTKFRASLPFHGTQPAATVEGDGERNEAESGDPRECSVSDVTAICYLVISDVPDADPVHLKVLVSPQYPDGATVIDGVVVDSRGEELTGADFPLLVDGTELIS